MRNFGGELVKMYYAVLNGNVTYNGSPVNVYNVSVSADEDSHYILLRPESETDASNKRSFVTSNVVVVDIVTVHDGAIDASVVDNIDDQVRQLLLTARNTTGLTDADGMQTLNVRADVSTYLDGFDGTRYEYRKITRFINRILQTT